MIGATAAYELAGDGHQVTLIERQGGEFEISFAYEKKIHKQQGEIIAAGRATNAFTSFAPETSFTSRS